MDVSCARCKTEYEFDEALISARGTTVRCTSCGLEFKIFPQSERAPPEIWQVRRDPDDEEGARSFESLVELQRAITRGEVAGSDYLWRGQEKPRRLDSIVELEPLLRHPKSVLPPPVVEVEPSGAGSAREGREASAGRETREGKEVRRAASGTALGLPSLADLPPEKRGAPPPPAPPRLERDEPSKAKPGPFAPLSDEVLDEIVETKLVPSEPPPAVAPRPEAALTSESETPFVPAVFSEALETPLAPTVYDAADLEEDRSEDFAAGRAERGEDRLGDERGEKGEAEDRFGDEEGEAERAPTSSERARPRIQSALSFAVPSDGEGELSSGIARHSEPPPPASLRERLPSLNSTWSQRPPGQVSTPPPLPVEVAPRVLIPTPDGTPLEGEPARDSSGRLPIAPSVGPLGPSPGASTSRSSDPMSSGSLPRGPLSSSADSGRFSGSLPSSQGRARSRLIVFAVLFGSGAFVLWAGQDAIRGWLSQAQKEPDRSVAAPEGLDRGAELRERHLEAEVAFWRTLLLPEGDPKRAAAEELAREQVPRWLAELERNPPATAEGAWMRIDLLRIAGRSQEARSLVRELPTPASPYSLALLDLVDTSAAPPWDAIVRRLEEARVGERSDYLATSALLYALAASGKLERARSELDELATLKGGRTAPLYDELRAWIERASAERPPELEVPAVALGDEPTAKKQGARVEWKPPPKAASPGVPEEVQGWVKQADALWASGNREGALVLYKQVVSKVGTGHFLAQRAQARISQAERETKGTEGGSR